MWLTLEVGELVAPMILLLCVKGGEKTVPRQDLEKKQGEQGEQGEQEEQEELEGQEGRRRARARAKATRVAVVVVVDSLKERGSGGGKS